MNSVQIEIEIHLNEEWLVVVEDVIWSEADRRQCQ